MNTKNSVQIVPFDENWEAQFQEEKQILENILKGLSLQILHVGSTSIVGLSAKPIIDIAIGTKSNSETYEVSSLLSCAGYEIIDKYDDKEEILAIKEENFETKFLIHIQIVGSKYWDDFVYFKKYLLDNPDEVKVYETIKIKLAEKYKNDRKNYTLAKSEYITKIIEKAKDIYNF